MKKKIVLSIIVFLNLYSLVAQTKPNKRLTQTELNNIVAFTKAYGIVRHFHPSSEIDNFDNWEEFIVYGISEIKGVNNRKLFIKKMNELFKPLAPTIVFTKKNKISNKCLDNIKTDSIGYRKNYGWGNKGRSLGRGHSLYKSSIEIVPVEKLPKFINSPTRYIKHQLSDNINLFLPQTLFYKNKKSRPKVSVPYNFKINNDFSIDDQNIRIGSIIISWNVMQHFYPYLKTMNIDTNKILKTYLQKSYTTKNENDFYVLLQKMMAEYKDGHSLITRADRTKWFYSPPIRVEKIENKTLVVGVFDSIIDFKIGDEIVKVNSINIDDYFNNEKKKYGGSTKGYLNFITYRKFLNGIENTTIDITYKRNDKIKTATLKRNIKPNKTKFYPVHNKTTYTEYKKNYYYINMSNMNDSILSKLINNEFIKAKGLIFDLRNSFYGKKDKILLSHFTNDTIKHQPWIVHNYYFPNQKKYNIADDKIDYRGSWLIPPHTPKFTNNVVFLIDNQMYSGRESYLAIVDHYNLGKTVGRNSAGTNGNTSIFNVFKLYYIFYTGMEVYQYNSSAFQGVGIKPNIYVDYKIEDLLNSKDTFIEKAKEILK